RINLAIDQGHMSFVVDLALKSHHLEGSKSGWKFRLCDQMDKEFRAQPIFDKVSHRNHLQPMLLCEIMKLLHASHGSIIVHDLANDSGRLQPWNAGEINCSFGLPGANQDTPFSRP